MKTEADRRNLDSVANEYAVKCFGYVMAVYAVVWALDQLNFFIVEKSIVSVGFASTILTYVATQIIFKNMNLAKPDTKYLMMFFIVVDLTIAASTLTYHVVPALALPLVYSIMYSSKKMTTYTFVLTVCCIFVSSIIGYFHGLCDANMVLLTTQKLADYTGPSGQFLLTTINQNPIFSVCFYYGFPRAIVIALLVPVCNAVSRIIREETIRATEMELLAETDSLTGVYTRGAGEKYIKQLIDHGITGTFCMIDCDDFKTINDTYGHDVGDKVLREIADRMKNCFRDKDIIMRYGGDEFAVFLTNMTDETSLRNCLDRLYRDIDKITLPEFENGRPTFSLGAEIYSIEKEMDYSSLYHHADEALYYAKRESKGTYHIYAR